ncbi:MAG: OmpA family protein [Archangiaceae bacterium]|nr:OmpA family protein [Archangiaceae bacterium]
MTRLAVALLLVFAVPSVAEERDFDGSKDHPLLSRMPGYYISSYEQKEWDAYDCAYCTAADAKWEGKLTRIGYTVQPGGRQLSMVQIARNYEGAMKKAGAKILSAEGNTTVAKFEKGGAKTYVQAGAFNEGSIYELVIVETKALEVEVVADAAALKQGLAAEGRIALYGIYFDTGKAVVKPESEPTLVQVTKLLKDNPALKLFVVGHTDSTATLEVNLKLSGDRAAAVVAALVGRGIDAGRLKAAGVGPYSPVATNRDEAGRAKNRRVELVERP